MTPDAVTAKDDRRVQGIENALDEYPPAGTGINGSHFLLDHEATITRAEPAVIPNDFHDLDPCGGLGGRCCQRLSRRGLATWSHATRFPDATCDGFGTALTKPYRKIDLAAKLRATLDSDP